MKKLFFCDVTDEEFQMFTDYVFKKVTDIPNRPPLGLKPRYIHDEERIIEIESAMKRYEEVYMPIPQEWWNELVNLKKGLYDLKYNKK